jgi:hypothetical protein
VDHIWLATIAVKRNAVSATQLCGSATVIVKGGGRKKKLKQNVLTIEAKILGPCPCLDATTRTNNK